MDDEPAAAAVAPPSVPALPGVRGLLALVREDLVTHHRDPRSPGFQALLAHRLARAAGRLPPGRLRAVTVSVCRLLQRCVISRFGIYLALSAQIGRHVYIPHEGGVAVHAGSIVGDDCWLRQRSVVASKDDGHAAVLGRDVRLGAGAVVMAGVTVGDGVRVGPNAVVTTDVAAGATVMPPRTTMGRSPAASAGESAIGGANVLSD